MQLLPFTPSYAATFPNSAISAVHKAPGDFPSGKEGGVLTVEFTVAGIPCLGLNDGRSATRLRSLTPGASPPRRHSSGSRSRPSPRRSGSSNARSARRCSNGGPEAASPRRPALLSARRRGPCWSGSTRWPRAFAAPRRTVRASRWGTSRRSPTFVYRACSATTASAPTSSSKRGRSPSSCERCPGASSTLRSSQPDRDDAREGSSSRRSATISSVSSPLRMSRGHGGCAISPSTGASRSPRQLHRRGLPARWRCIAARACRPDRCELCRA